MKRLIFTLLAGCAVFGMVNAKTLTINPAAGPVTIDGYTDEDAWNASPSFTSMETTKAGTEADKNNTAKFKLIYDAKNLYVYVEILDATLDTSQSKDSWLKDCTEVFVSLDTLSQAYSPDGSNSSHQFRKVFGRNIEGDGNPTARGVKLEEVEITGGRAQEWQIPFDSLATQLKDPKTWDKKNIRFEIQNGDNDGAGRKSQLFWNSAADDQYQNTTNQGYGVLLWTLNVKQVAGNNEISFSNNLIKANSSTTIKVYNTAGMLVKVANNVNQLNVADLKSGIYAATANNQTIKFFKK
jgi:hypothetical protein